VLPKGKNLHARRVAGRVKQGVVPAGSIETGNPETPDTKFPHVAERHCSAASMVGFAH
jgi:hypothetical protein